MIVATQPRVYKWVPFIGADLAQLFTRMAHIFHQDKWKQGHTQVLELPFSTSEAAEAFHLGWQGRTIGIYAVVAW